MTGQLALCPGARFYSAPTGAGAAWDAIISGLLAAISISGYIPTSGDITFSTIKKLDLQNMGIAVGIFFVGGTELEIHLGVILPHTPLDIRRCKNLDTGGLTCALLNADQSRLVWRYSLMTDDIVRSGELLRDSMAPYCTWWLVHCH